MSYRKYYGRMFVKLSENKWLPLILWGSNNCSEFVNGREVLQRYWCSFSPTEITTTTDFINYIRKRTKENPEDTVWMNGSKWVYWTQMERWMKNSFDSGLTIEEIYRITGKSLTITLARHDYLTDENEIEKEIEAKTTTDIIEFFKYYEDLSDEERKHYSLWYDFETREPLKIPKPDVKGKVIVKDRKYKNYLYSYETEKELNFSCDPNTALVFESVEDALTKIGRNWRNVKIVSIKALEEAKKPRYFAIYTGYHGFVQQRTRSRLYFTRSEKCAKLFKTEKEATKYMNELKGCFNLTFEVVDIRRLEVKK